MNVASTGTIMTLSFRTYRSGPSGPTVQTQIRLLLEEQPDPGLHFCLLFLFASSGFPKQGGFGRTAPPTPVIGACYFWKKKEKKEEKKSFSLPEPKAHGELKLYLWSGVRPSVVRRRPQFQRSSFLKPLCRSKPNFMWGLLG